MSNKPPYPAVDGGTIASFAMLKAFSEAGNEVTVLTFSTPKHRLDVKKLPEEVQKMARFVVVEIDTNPKPLQAIENLLFTDTPYIADRFLSEDYENELIKLLKNQEFDIIQLEGLYLMPYISTIRKHSQATVSLRAHNIEHEIWERISENQTNSLRKWYFKNLTKRLKTFELSFLNQHDVLIPITNRDAMRFNQFGNKKPFLVCPVGTDMKTEVFENQVIKYPSLFHLGALDWIPNQEGILWFLKECWASILQHFPDVKFYIAGRNAPESFVKQITYPNVEYLGTVPDATEFLKDKAVMVVPLWAGSGMRVKIVEGMAHRKAIVSTSIGVEGMECSKKEKDLCFLVADTPQEFVKNVVKLLSDRNFYDKIATNAYEFIHSHFNNQKIIEKLILFYQEQITKK